MRPCHYVTEPGVGRILIPGCMGSAVYGKRGCTCGTKHREDIHDRLDNLAEAVANLTLIVGKQRP